MWILLVSKKIPFDTKEEEVGTQAKNTCLRLVFFALNEVSEILIATQVCCDRQFLLDIIQRFWMFHYSRHEDPYSCLLFSVVHARNKLDTRTIPLFYLSVLPWVGFLVSSSFSLLSFLSFFKFLPLVFWGLSAYSTTFQKFPRAFQLYYSTVVASSVGVALKYSIDTYCNFAFDLTM